MTSAWLERRVIAYAHQGGAWEGPSSTLYAIEPRSPHGATAVELDVHATKDRHLVVCHDETVDRTTDGAGQICDLTLEELRRLDNAYWWAPGADVSPGLADDAYPLRGRAPADPSLRVATLDEVLERLAGVVVNLDIKRTAPDVEPYEGLLAEALRATGAGTTPSSRASRPRHRGVPRRGPRVPHLARHARDRRVLPRGAHRGARAGDDRVALQVPQTFGDVTVVDERFVERAHEVGLAVHVWTVNEAATMRALVELGVDGIISDTPSALVERAPASGLRVGVRL